MMTARSPGDDGCFSAVRSWPGIARSAVKWINLRSTELFEREHSPEVEQRTSTSALAVAPGPARMSLSAQPRTIWGDGLEVVGAATFLPRSGSGVDVAETNPCVRRAVGCELAAPEKRWTVEQCVSRGVGGTGSSPDGRCACWCHGVRPGTNRFFRVRRTRLAGRSRDASGVRATVGGRAQRAVHSETMARTGAQRSVSLENRSAGWSGGERGAPLLFVEVQRRGGGDELGERVGEQLWFVGVREVP